MPRDRAHHISRGDGLRARDRESFRDDSDARRRVRVERPGPATVGVARRADAAGSPRRRARRRAVRVFVVVFVRVVRVFVRVRVRSRPRARDRVASARGGGRVRRSRLRARVRRALLADGARAVQRDLARGKERRCASTRAASATRSTTTRRSSRGLALDRTAENAGRARAGTSRTERSRTRARRVGSARSKTTTRRSRSRPTAGSSRTRTSSTRAGASESQLGDYAGARDDFLESYDALSAVERLSQRERRAVDAAVGRRRVRGVQRRARAPSGAFWAHVLFFTRPSVSTFDRVSYRVGPFQLTGALHAYTCTARARSSGRTTARATRELRDVARRAPNVADARAALAAVLYARRGDRRGGGRVDERVRHERRVREV